MRRRSELVRRFNSLLNRLSARRRKEIEPLLEWLKRDGEFFRAPASTSKEHHLPYPGGLLEHSINVAEYMLRLRDILAPDIPDDSVIIVGLFHDLGKIGSPGAPLYLPNPDKKERKEKPYIHNPSLVRMGVPIRSLSILSRFVTLSEEETQAICYHDGQYVPENEIVAHHERPLTLLVHFADIWCATIVEKEAKTKQTKNSG